MSPQGRRCVGTTPAGYSPDGRRVGFPRREPPSLFLVKSAFFPTVSLTQSVQGRGCTVCLQVLVLAFLSCVPVVAKQHGILVTFPQDDQETAHVRTSVVPPVSDRVPGAHLVAPFFSGDPPLTEVQQSCASDQGDVGNRAEEDAGGRAYLRFPATLRASREATEEQKKHTESDTEQGAEDDGLEADAVKKFTKDAGRAVSESGAQTPAKLGVTRRGGLSLVASVASSGTGSALHTLLKRTAAGPPAPVPQHDSPPAAETVSNSATDISFAPQTDWPAAAVAHDSSSPSGFSLQEELRFPSSLLNPLWAPFAPSPPPPRRSSLSPSHDEIFRKYIEADDTQQQFSGDKSASAARRFEASVPWIETLAEDIHKRILELTGQRPSHIHMNKGILRLLSNIRRSISGKNDASRETEENNGDAAGGAGDPVRKAKKPLPPFDKQTRKHVSHVQEWYTVSVGATMNGMRDQDEDALVVSAALDNFPNARMFSLFDGHAGQEAARRCSANASRIFGQLSGLSPAALKQACLELDERIRNYPGPCLKSGSTGVIAIVNAVEVPSGTVFNIHVASVGDSRAFLLHMTEDTYEILTRDHKPNHAEELQRIQKAGGCVRRMHKRVWRVNGFLALSRSFGDFALKRVASKAPEEQQVTAVPGTSTATARPGDYLLLGCDGVFEGEGMSWDFVARLLKDSIVYFRGDIGATVDYLITIAYVLGSRDNISILLISFNDKKLTPQVKRYEIEVDGTSRELPVEILPGKDVSTSTAGVYKGDDSLLVTLFS